jgi:hypothetical protein
MRRPALLIFSAWLCLAVVSPAGAVALKSWSASTGDQFTGGTLRGTAVDEEGRVRLAPPLETLWGPAQGIVWDLLPTGADGVFVALSGPGRVLRVVRGRPDVTLYESPGESLVTALASDGTGSVLAGLSPEGRVLRIGEAGGATPVAETGAMFIWAMERDDKGTLWIGTGAPGRLLRVEEGKEPQTIFDAGDDPVRSLVLLPGGGLVIGTGGQGRVIRIDAEGRPFVLLDAEEAEIVALAVVRDGSLFALAAADQKQPVASPAAGPGSPQIDGGVMRVVVRAAPPNGEESPPADPESTEQAQPPNQAFRSPPGGALYRLDPDGSTRRIWETTTEMPFCLVARAKEELLVGTGDEGRIWKLDGEGRASLLLRIPSNQASAFGAGPGGELLIGGTTDARVELLGAGPRAEGSYLGPAVDAGSTADWGRVSWSAELPAGAKLRMRARSGNTAVPDETWSDWRDLPQAAAPSGVPAARWFQVRADLSAGRGTSPRLSRIDLRYLPRNRPPAVTVLAVEPPGVVWARAPVQSSRRTGPQVADDPVSRGIAAAVRRGGLVNGAIRKSYEAGARTFTWSVEDPDDDRLVFSLELRSEEGSTWFPLANGLVDEYHSWDSRSVPDGRYRIRLTADDSPDNADGSERRALRVSDAFLIDNTRPELGEPDWSRTVEGWRVRFVARDPGGAIVAAEFNLDGGDWQPLRPLDGVADSDEERFEIDLGGRQRDATFRGLGVRAVDAAGNLAGAVWVAPSN